VKVSTDVENQSSELGEVAEHCGWRVVEIYEDASIGGAKGRISHLRSHEEQ